MNDLLNPYQKKALATALRTFEDNLRQAQSWLDGNEVDGILYRRKLNLSAEHRGELRQRIAVILEDIATLAAGLGLEKKFEDPAGLISGQMSIAWANLIDSQASKLKRFGEVHPELSHAIDPHIQKMAQSAMELAVLFGNNSSNLSSPDAEILYDI